MSEDYFQTVWIGLNKVLLFGTRADGEDFDRVLKDDERHALERLEAKHAAEMNRFLRALSLGD